MMGAALPAGTCAARLMLFVGGPSTEGAGKVVDKELSEPIRSHEARTSYCLCQGCLCRRVCFSVTLLRIGACRLPCRALAHRQPVCSVSAINMWQMRGGSKCIMSTRSRWILVCKSILAMALIFSRGKEG